jgi:CRISPR/Cas system-associated protein Csx1
MLIEEFERFSTKTENFSQFGSGVLKMQNNDVKRKRIDRKKKLKRIFNYDDEINFLKSYKVLKKSLSLDELKIEIKKTLIDTEQVSDVVAQYFIEELKTQELIKDKEEEKKHLTNKINSLNDEITELKESLKEEEDEDGYGYGSDDFFNID